MHMTTVEKKSCILSELKKKDLLNGEKNQLVHALAHLPRKTFLVHQGFLETNLASTKSPTPPLPLKAKYSTRYIDNYRFRCHQQRNGKGVERLLVIYTNMISVQSKFAF